MRKKATNPYRRLDRAERAAIERGLDKRKSCRQMARSWADRRRRSPTRWRATALCREGRAKGGRAARAPDGACQAAVVAALLQRVQVPQVPLRPAVALRVLGGQGAGARRRRTARIQDGRGPGRGRVRIHNGPDKVRRRARAVARADRAGQGG